MGLSGAGECFLNDIGEPLKPFGFSKNSHGQLIASTLFEMGRSLNNAGRITIARSSMNYRKRVAEVMGKTT
jgi:uncharacterized protein (DUF2141 family)